MTEIPERIGDYYLCDFDKQLYALVIQLEKRIIQLEVELSKKRLVMDNDDAWYWDH